MKVIAHRGASRECPENTRQAFERAIEIGVDAIETDVQKTADSRLILHHDDRVRLHGKMSPVNQLTFSELKTGAEGKQIPALEELFGLARGRVPLCLELKTAGLVPDVLALIRQYGAEGTSHVTSFLYPEIREVRRLCPELAVSVTFQEYDRAILPALINDGIFEISLAYPAISAETARELNQKGFQVRVYTVNSPEAAVRLESWGVAAIFTDDPRAMQFLRK